MAEIELMIVEDEPEVLDGIASAVREMNKGVAVIHTASNAEDALAIVRSRRPQVIVTDIVLPRMSGLGLIEEAQRLGSNAKVVVISSHDRFGYVQRSLQLGAVDYVLKPIDKAEFCGKLDRLLALIADEEAETRRIRDQRERAVIGTKVLDDQFVLGLCTHGAAMREHVLHRLQLIGLSWLASHAYVAVSLCIADQRDRDNELRLFAAHNVMEETASQIGHTYLVRAVHPIWLLLTAYPDAEEVIEAIRGNVRHYQKMELHVGLSNRMYAFQSLPEAYAQCMQAIRLADAERRPIVYYAETGAGEGGEPWSEDVLIDVLLTGAADRIAPLVGEKLGQMALEMKIGDRSQLAYRCLNWILELAAQISERTSVVIEQIPLSFWERLERCDGLEAMKAELTAYLSELSGKLSSHLPGMGNALIEKAKTIIADHENGDLTLQSLAQRLELHPVWLSRLFKKETGQTFSDYMIEARIDRAKHLLRHTSLRIYEIASMLGYQDLQHFGKVFKRRAGVTPKQYRYGK